MQINICTTFYVIDLGLSVKVITQWFKFTKVQVSPGIQVNKRLLQNKIKVNYLDIVS